MKTFSRQGIIALMLTALLTMSSFSAYAAAEVWVNTKSKVYHCPGARWYGKTKRGFLLEETQAIQRGYRAASNRLCSPEGKAEIQKKSQSKGANISVWLNTSSKVYHCPGTRYYGNTKRGRFVTQGDALSIGGRPAGGRSC